MTGQPKNASAAVASLEAISAAMRRASTTVEPWGTGRPVRVVRPAYPATPAAVLDELERIRRATALFGEQYAAAFRRLAAAQVDPVEPRRYPPAKRRA